MPGPESISLLSLQKISWTNEEMDHLDIAGLVPGIKIVRVTKLVHFIYLELFDKHTFCFCFVLFCFYHFFLEKFRCFEVDSLMVKF